MRGVMIGSEQYYEIDELLNLTCIRDAEGSILLGRKTRGFGVGKLVFPGGKELYKKPYDLWTRDVREQQAREIREETGLDINPHLISKAGVLYVLNGCNEYDLYLGHVQLDETKPKVTDSPELIDIAWHPEKQLPYDDMPSDYSFWLPKLLEGNEIAGELILEGEEIIEGHITGIGNDSRTWVQSIQS